MLQIVPAGHDLRDAALMLLYGRRPEGDPKQLSEMQMAVESGEVPLDDLLVALVDDRPIGAILAVRRAGGMAFVWPPATIDDTGGMARLLLQTIAQRLDSGGTQFAQCLLETDDAAAKTVMNDGGFPYLTDILLLNRSVAAPADPLANALTTTAYEDETHGLFVQVMESTFDGTLDCPSLTRLRRGDEALAAHRASGGFDPALWQVFHSPDGTVGVLLCVEHSERRVREIAYMGVVPHARGRGIGRAMLCHTLEQARRADCDFLEVAVDACNRYALEIYRHLGFSVERRMAVHLRLFGGDAIAAD